MKTKSPLEGQAFEVFTPFAFKMFQDEFIRANQYSIIQVEGSAYIIRFFEGEKGMNRRVLWDGTTISCS